MDNARRVEPGFFPLDEELELLGWQLTPRLSEGLIELGGRLPSFEVARKVFEKFTGVQVSEATVRRYTEAAGGVCVILESEAVEELEKTMPSVEQQAVKMVVEVDGSMVPIVGGEWVEVKTVAIGTVQPCVQSNGETIAETRDLSYFSRHASAEQFERLALFEIHRRGVEGAHAVAAVNDGAEWINGFLDSHCPGATRILDFAHAASYVAKLGQAQFGADSPECATWLHAQLHELKHNGPERMLDTLRALVRDHPQAQALDLSKALTYLEKRSALMQYPCYQAEHWPIGSGAVESGQKTVIQARLQGAGMHWAISHIDPMLALRNALCNERWDEVWPQIQLRMRRNSQHIRRSRCKERKALNSPVVPTPVETAPAPKPKAPAKPDPARPRRSHTPADDHPWRRSYKTIPSKL